MTREEYFGDWCKIMDMDMLESILNRLPSNICPLSRDIFKAFNLCSLKDLKVLILGQDPYFNFRNGKPVATGIAFANSKDTPESSYSPSLEILRESIIDFTKPHGLVTFDVSLEELEGQGVLFLNSALTCLPGNPGSHVLLWRPFMQSLLSSLSKYMTGCVYVLMGSQAQSFEPYINKGFNHVIRIRHPAYYARAKVKMPSDIWSEVNDILVSKYGYGIEWYKEY